MSPFQNYPTKPAIDAWGDTAKLNRDAWGDTRLLLSSLDDSIIVSIPDNDGGDNKTERPIIHSAAVDLSLQEKGYGIFYSLNGFFDAKKRTQRNLKSYNACYADIDWPKDRLGLPPKSDPKPLNNFKRDVLESLLSLSYHSILPTFIIETKNGYHAIWCFPTPILTDTLPNEIAQNPLPLFTETQTLICDLLSGDPMAKDPSRVFRLPNTYHLKDPNDPFLVKVVYKDPTNKYPLERINDAFRSIRSPGSDAPRQKTVIDKKSLSAATYTDIFDVSHDIPTVPSTVVWKFADGSSSRIPGEALIELNKRYPKTSRPSVIELLKKEGRPEGTRDSALLRAVCAMRESGVNEEGCLKYFDHYNGLSPYVIERKIKAVYRLPEDRLYSFGWDDPLISPYVTAAERAEVSGHLAAIMNDLAKKQKSLAHEMDKDGTKPYGNKSVPKARSDKAPPTGPTLNKEAKDETAKEILAKRFQNLEKIIVESCEAEGHPIRYFNPDFYIYDRGAYSKMSPDDIDHLIIRHMEDLGLNAYKTRSSVGDKRMCLAALSEIRVKTSDVDHYPTLQNILNGLIDVSTKAISDHSPKVFITNQLPVTYDPNKTIVELAPRWLGFIREITRGDEEKALFLQQMAGYCLTRSVEFQCLFVLIGNGANGKSTFLDAIASILTLKNVSHLTLQDLQKNFMVSGLFNKTLNVIEEVSKNYIESDVIKRLTGGVEITADVKNKQPIIFKPFAKHILAVNTMPKINDSSFALHRRLKFIPFTAKFSDNSDPDLSQKLWAERDGIFAWMMDGWIELKKRRMFVMTEEMEDLLKQFRETNSSLADFLVRAYANDAAAKPILLTTLYAAYRNDVEKYGGQFKSIRAFQSELASLDIRTFPGMEIVDYGKNGVKAVTGVRPIEVIPETLPDFIQRTNPY